MDTIGSRVEAVIKAQGITKLQFGKDIGMTSGAVTCLCKDKNGASSGTIKSICRTYNVNETWLTTGEGEMYNASTEEEEIAFLLGAALTDERAPFRRKLVKLVLELPPEAILRIEEYARLLLTEDEKKD